MTPRDFLDRLKSAKLPEMTEPADLLLGFLGGILITWGLAEAIAGWVWPIGLGVMALFVFVAGTGLRNIRMGLWWGRADTEKLEERTEQVERLR